MQKMDRKKLNHYKHLLEQHKERHQDILDDMENLSLGENDNNNTSDLSNYDNHPAEIASDLFDVEQQIGLKKLQASEIDLIERAKEKIKEGTYGICEDCCKEIDPARLELLPHARLCIDCAREQDEYILRLKGDKRKRRPAEEQVTHASNMNDTLKGEVLFDVLEYGSADSHQDRGGEID